MFALILLSSALFYPISITERLFSSGTSYEICHEGMPGCVIDRRLFSFQTIFDLRDSNYRLLATIKARFPSPLLFLGAIGDIVDADGQKLGRIEKKISGLSPWLEYQLYDAEECWIATARFDIWQLSVEVFSSSDSNLVYATLQLPYYHHVRREWILQIQEDAIDRRILYFLPILHSALEE